MPEREVGPVVAYERSPGPDPAAFNFYRTTNDLSRLGDKYNKTGLEKLFLSGSESISSEEQVRSVYHQAGVKRLYFANLRLESNVIVDKYPVVLRGPMDWSKVGMSRQEALDSEKQWVAELKEQPFVEIQSWKDIKAGKEEPRSICIDHPVIRTEDEIVQAIPDLDIEFRRFTVIDHLRPQRHDVDRFTQLVAEMPEGSGLHLHCAGGRGRTTTFMTMFDMLHNASEVSAKDIIERQEVLGYSYKLASLDPNKLHKQNYHADRLNFLYLFYEYAKRNPLGKPMSWAEWRESDATSPGTPDRESITDF